MILDAGGPGRPVWRTEVGGGTFPGQNLPSCPGSRLEEGVMTTETGDYATTFALIDVDGDGLISASELRNLMSALGAEITDDAAEHAVQVLDVDGDGLVSLDELATYLDRHEPAPAPATEN